MSDFMRLINLEYCQGARFIKETLGFYVYPDEIQTKRALSHSRLKYELFFDESGKLRDCVSHYDDVSFACRLFYDKKNRLEFTLIMNADKTKVAGGCKYVYDEKNRLSSVKHILHYDGFAKPLFNNIFEYYDEKCRYRSSKVSIVYTDSQGKVMRRKVDYSSALHDGNYDFKQLRAPASIIHNRMLIPYLFVNSPCFSVDRSDSTGKYFSKRSLAFNERGHWTSLFYLDSNEQPWLEHRREISYYDSFSPAVFQPNQFQMS